MTDDVHVVHVINRLSPTGGAEVSLVQSLPHLRRAGVRSTVVTLLPHIRGSRVAEARAAGADVVCLDTSGPAMGTVGLARLLPALGADLVHTTLFDAGVAGRVAAGLRGVPAVTSVVNTVYSPEVAGENGRPVTRWLLQQVDGQLARHATVGIHALTEFAASAARAELGVDPGMITVIPRGRDRTALGEPGLQRRDAVRRALGLGARQPVVLTVGRQERQKAHHLLVEAFVGVRDKHEDAVLLIAGRAGANSDRLTDAVAESGLPENSVRILGARNDVPDLLCAADLFALPSLWEGLGGVLLEAMAMEVPLVTFALPPVLEVVGNTGVVVPIGDVPGLADAIIALLDDPARRRSLACAARGRFEHTYRMEAVAAQMAEWYRSMARPR